MNEEAYVTQPAYKFTLEGTEVFQPSAQFTRLNITSKDSLSGKLLALQTLQKLISFHLHDASPDALVDAELKRFFFLHKQRVRIKRFVVCRWFKGIRTTLSERLGKCNRFLPAGSILCSKWQ